jgi:hypothetical protein
MLSRVEFRALMDTWRTSAWRWECQGVYREPSEQEPLRKFLAGEPDLSWFAGWLARVRTWTAAGQRMGRVRALTDPLTDYLQFELSITPPAIEAGEDIRFLPAGRADELELPDHDFWLFDDERVAVMTFGEHGVSGAELVTEPGKVAAYRAWRDTAVAAAVPLSDLHLTT